MGHARGSKGVVRVGSLTELGKYLVMPAIIRVAADFPDVNFVVRLQKGDEIIQGLMEHELDFGIIAARPEQDSMQISTLLEERSLLVTRNANNRNVTTTGDAIAASFVAYRENDPLLTKFISQHFPAITKAKIRPRFVVNDHKCMLDILTATDSFAVVPTHAVTGLLEAGILRNASPYDLRSPIYLARPEKARDTPYIRALIKSLS
jgi:DNA-binding transcriptional LysR family regulator